MCHIQLKHLMCFLNVELKKDTNNYQLINQPTHKVRLIQQLLNSLFYFDDIQRLFPSIPSILLNIHLFAL